MPAVASALATNNVKTQYLGTGVLNDARQMQGAWFFAPDNYGFNALAQRYKARFNSEPTRWATLAYDAVTLAAASPEIPARPLWRKGADQRIRLQRRRWRVPLPSGRNQRTGPAGCLGGTFLHWR